MDLNYLYKRQAWVFQNTYSETLPPALQIEYDMISEITLLLTVILGRYLPTDFYVFLTAS